MIALALLAATLSFGQEVSTTTADKSLSINDDIRIKNAETDIRGIQRGKYRQTGQPTFAGGFCFADGTCQTTASSNTVITSSCGYQTAIGAFAGGTTFSSVAGSSLTWTSVGGFPRVAMKTHFLAFNNRDVVCLKALIDAGNSGTRTICAESVETPSGGSNSEFNFEARWTQTISTGSHKVQLYYKTSNGSGVQIPQTLAGEDGSQLCVYDNQ